MGKKLLIIWSGVLIYVLFNFINYNLQSKHNKEIYSKINKSIEVNIKKEKSTNFHEDLSGILQEEAPKEIMGKYNSIYNMNTDIVGWINVPSVSISYPVFKAKDNEFYLKKNPYKEASNSGSIFMDFRNEGLAKDVNTILYGHNMKDGSMFGELMRYKKREFLEKNPVIQFSTLYEDLTWQIFSVYVTDINFNYIKTEFNDTSELKSFLSDIKTKSMFPIDCEVLVEDNIITLSTCSDEFYNSRFVIHAKKVSTKESFNN